MAVVELGEFNLAWLHTFLCVQRLGGYSKAAERLGISQGTASRQVEKLERWFGGDLLTKNRPPRLTARGEKVCALAERIVFEICDFNGIAGRVVRNEPLSEQEQVRAEGLRIFNSPRQQPDHA